MSSEPYLINLGTLPNGKPHWLNGKTLQEAAADWDKVTGTTSLRRAYDYYKKSKYRSEQIHNFLEAADTFYKLKEG